LQDTRRSSEKSYSTTTMASNESLWATVTGSIQGSISVLLTIAAGYMVTRAGLLDRASTKKISNIASLVFLPCLIIVQMGPNLTPGEAALVSLPR
jgi:predicted permease